MAKISKNLNVSQPRMLSGKLTMLPLIFLVFCAICQPTEAQTRIYVFDPNRSTVVQTGGFAGVDETYPIEGYFQLSIDIDAGFASFEKVDANMLEPSGFLYTENLGVLFNMTGLSGTVVDDTTMEFVGKTADGTESDVSLKLNFSADSAHLTGKTTPPPNSADMFIYDVNAVATKKYAGGTGEPHNPYLIYTAEQMNTIGTEPNDWDKHFKLMADIDLSTFTGDLFNIIPVFSGSFDGNGHNISNFTYISTEERPVGLFRCVGYGGKIKDLGLRDPNIVAESSYGVSALVGWLGGGSMSSCYVQGGKVMGYDSVGGLIGDNGGTVNSCYSTANVSGNNRVGGLVGANWNSSLYGNGSIHNCYTACNVMGATDIGGLVGYNNSIIKNSFWDIETSGLNNMCGSQGFCNNLNGKTTSEMQNPDTFMNAGWDFVDQADGPSDVWAAPAEGEYPQLWWQLSPPPPLPEFSGGSGTWDDPYLISTDAELNNIGHNPRLMEAHFKLVNDIDLARVEFAIIGKDIFPFKGTFDGNNFEVSHFSYSSTEEDYIGLFGCVKGMAAEIKSLGLTDPNIDAGTGSYVGCLVGELSDGTITRCYTKDGSVSGHKFVGGLLGENWMGTVSNCHATCFVSGTGFCVGGLTGENRGPISACYTNGEVKGTGDQNCWSTGGLVGRNNNEISNCHSSCKVSGRHSVGGLVGDNSYGSAITNCYSGASVSGNSSVGGLVGGGGEELIANSFWDIETSGQATSAGGTGKTTAEMQTASTFLEAGWDFVDEMANGTEDIWWILEGQDYPRLWWEAK